MPNEEAPGSALVTVEEIKIAKGEALIESRPEDELRYEQAINTASAAIRKFCDRTFGLAVSESTKIYEYEDGGLLEIDDAWEVQQVVFIFGEFKFPLEKFYWRAEPQEGPPYTYLKIPHWTGVYDPAMGFTRGLDIVVRDRGWPWIIPQVEVKAKWGWEEVPLDVKQAAIYTAIDFAEVPKPYVGESIAGYSYQTAIRTTAGPGETDLVPTAIPGKAQDLLLPYVRAQF